MLDFHRKSSLGIAKTFLPSQETNYLKVMSLDWRDIHLIPKKRENIFLLFSYLVASKKFKKLRLEEKYHCIINTCLDFSD